MSKSIAIAGCMGHIGTTTQCLQVIKVLERSGYQAYYQEKNETKYIEQLIDLYANAEEREDKIIYSGIHFYKNKTIYELTEESYDYAVIDYGSVLSKDFKKTLFIQSPIKAIVCGSKPSEFLRLQEILKDPDIKDLNLIFSFVPMDERKNIEMPENKNIKQILFAEYVPNPFIWSNGSDTLLQMLN